MLLGLCQVCDSKEKKDYLAQSRVSTNKNMVAVNYAYTQEENVRLKLFNIRITGERHGTQENQSVSPQ